MRHDPRRFLLAKLRAWLHRAARPVTAAELDAAAIQSRAPRSPAELTEARSALERVRERRAHLPVGSDTAHAAAEANTVEPAADATTDRSEHAAAVASRRARILAQAIAVFGQDRVRAVAWLETPCRALGGRVPAALLATAAGERAVAAELGSLAADRAAARTDGGARPTPPERT